MLLVIDSESLFRRGRRHTASTLESLPRSTYTYAFKRTRSLSRRFVVAAWSRQTSGDVCQIDDDHTETLYAPMEYMCSDGGDKRENPYPAAWMQIVRPDIHILLMHCARPGPVAGRRTRVELLQTSTSADFRSITRPYRQLRNNARCIDDHAIIAALYTVEGYQ